MNINWRFVLSKSWKAFLMGLLIAVGIALFPQAQCAVAQTCDAPRDLWCGSGQCCGQTAGFDAVIGCQKSGLFCREIMDRRIPARCENADNCLVTWVGRLSSRLSKEYVPGRGWVTYWYVGKCEWTSCSLNTTANKQEVSCCSGGGGGGCTPQYAPPVIDDTYTVDPPYPIVWSQEQPPYGQALGMTINDIKAHGGVDTTCGTGQRANITSMTINLTLTDTDAQLDFRRTIPTVHQRAAQGDVPAIPRGGGYWPCIQPLFHRDGAGGIQHPRRGIGLQILPTARSWGVRHQRDGMPVGRQVHDQDPAQSGGGVSHGKHLERYMEIRDE